MSGEPYEPPVITPVGNLHELLRYVCPPGPPPSVLPEGFITETGPLLDTPTTSTGPLPTKEP